MIILMLPFLSSIVYSQKKWPNYQLKGINVKLISSFVNNNQNPGQPINDSTFSLFKSWNVEIIRMFISKDDDYRQVKNDKDSVQNYLQPYEKHLKALDESLRLAKKYKLFIILAVGGLLERRNGILYAKRGNAGYYSSLIKIWVYIAKKYNKNRWLIGYDLLNEPHTENENKTWIPVVFPMLRDSIRKYDTSTSLIVEPGEWDNPSAYKNLKPIDDQHVIYSFHFYEPHNFTHQGIKGLPRWKASYPGYLPNLHNPFSTYWGKIQLQNAMKPVEDFKNKYGAHVMVGEFGVVRWAIGAEKWLSDVIQIFNNNNFDWCYFSYGGVNAWNPTFSERDSLNNDINGYKNTSILQLLKHLWK